MIDVIDILYNNINHGSVYTELIDDYIYYNYNYSVSEYLLLNKDQISLWSNLLQGKTSKGKELKGLVLHPLYPTFTTELRKGRNYDAYFPVKYHIRYSQVIENYDDHEFTQVCVNPDEHTLKIFERSLELYLRANKVELCPLSYDELALKVSNSKTYDHSRKKTIINRNLKSKTLNSSRVSQGCYTQSWVHKDPSEIRDLWIPDLNTKETLLYFTNLLGQINRKLPHSGQSDEITLNHRIKRLMDGKKLLGEIDVRKSGKTISYRFIRSVAEVLSRVYPTIDWLKMYCLYSSPTIHSKSGDLPRPLRGIGYGHGNELYTLSMCAILNFIGMKGLAFNDDIIFRFKTDNSSTEIKRLINEELLSVEWTFKSLGFELNPKKRVISKAGRFLEIYTNTHLYGVDFNKDILSWLGYTNSVLGVNKEHCRHRFHEQFVSNGTASMDAGICLLPMIISLLGITDERLFMPYQLGGWKVYQPSNFNQIARIVMAKSPDGEIARKFLCQLTQEEYVHLNTPYNVQMKKKVSKSLVALVDNYDFEISKDLEVFFPDLNFKRFKSKVYDSFTHYGMSNMRPSIVKVYWLLQMIFVNKIYKRYKSNYKYSELEIERWLNLFADKYSPLALPEDAFEYCKTERVLEKERFLISFSPWIKVEKEYDSLDVLRQLKSLNTLRPGSVRTKYLELSAYDPLYVVSKFIKDRHSLQCLFKEVSPDLIQVIPGDVEPFTGTTNYLSLREYQTTYGCIISSSINEKYRYPRWDVDPPWIIPHAMLYSRVMPSLILNRKFRKKEKELLEKIYNSALIDLRKFFLRLFVIAISSPKEERIRRLKDLQVKLLFKPFKERNDEIVFIWDTIHRLVTVDRRLDPNSFESSELYVDYDEYDDIIGNPITQIVTPAYGLSKVSFIQSEREGSDQIRTPINPLLSEDKEMEYVPTSPSYDWDRTDIKWEPDDQPIDLKTASPDQVEVIANTLPLPEDDDEDDSSIGIAFSPSLPEEEKIPEPEVEASISITSELAPEDPILIIEDATNDLGDDQDYIFDMVNAEDHDDSDGDTPPE